MTEQKNAVPDTGHEYRYKALLIGGYGFFGKKLAQRLARDELLDVVIAGRDRSSAQSLADALNRETNSHRFSAVELDAADSSLCDHIQASGANLVIYTCGPFQGQDYAVARACIQASVHYIDLADATDFVAGISVLDGEARQAGVLVTSGASSVPALSSAVVDALSHDFSSVGTIDIGISPGNRTDRGLATVKAILSYCGAPIRQWRHGQWEQAYGWQDLRRQTYAPPVSRRWLANCDVPDLALFPTRYAGVQNVRFQAGLELPWLHFGVWLMAGLRRAGIVADWARYANSLKKLSDWFIGFGSDAGAMHVEIDGIGQDGSKRRRRWILVAAKGDGPYVPTLASAVLAGKLARNHMAHRGALPCMGLLTLNDFTDAMAGLAITMETIAS